MLVRFLLILTLFLQPIASTVALAMAASGGQAVACEAASCCQVFETVSCCGKIVQQMRCGKTGGQCLCGVDPGDPERSPQAPRPQERQDLAPIVVSAVGGLIDLPAPIPAPRNSAQLAPCRTHNEIQAVLCIWRT